jgi:hypothetical protein
MNCLSFVLLFVFVGVSLRKYIEKIVIDCPSSILLIALVVSASEACTIFSLFKLLKDFIQEVVKKIEEALKCTPSVPVEQPYQNIFRV